MSRARSEDQWKRVSVPEWRIVPETLWAAVQARITEVSRRFGAQRLGGLNRTERSRSYLFSGLLVCGQCGSRIVIISGQGKRGYVRYGCPSHRYRGVCENSLTIRQDRLEAQLIGALEERIVNCELLDYTFDRFQAELGKRLTDMQQQASALEELRRERRQLQLKAERIADAIADAGHSPAMLAKLGSLEAQIAEIDRQLDAQRPIDFSATVGELREFVTRNLGQLRKLLRGNVSEAKQALARHIGQLKLTPKQTPEGDVYEIQQVRPGNNAFRHVHNADDHCRLPRPFQSLAGLIDCAAVRADPTQSG